MCLLSSSIFLVAVFPRRLWAEVPKITRLVLALVGPSLPLLAAGQTCLLLKAGVSNICCPCSYFPRPPFASLPRAVAPPLLLLFLQSRRVVAHLCGLKAPPVFSGKYFCPTVSLQSVLAQLSLEEACAVCALEFLPALSPESVDQMSCMSAEPSTVAGTPCLLVLPRAAVSQLWS